MAPYISVIPQVEALLATYRNSSVLLGTILLLASTNYVRLYDTKPGRSTCWYRYHSEKIAWETCFAATDHPFPGIEPPEGKQMSFAEATAPATSPAPSEDMYSPSVSEEPCNDGASMYSVGFNASLIDLSETISNTATIATAESTETEHGSAQILIFGSSSAKRELGRAKKELGRTRSWRHRQPRPRESRDLWGTSWNLKL